MFGRWRSALERTSVFSSECSRSTRDLHDSSSSSSFETRPFFLDSRDFSVQCNDNATSRMMGMERMLIV